MDKYIVRDSYKKVYFERFINPLGIEIPRFTKSKKKVKTFSSEEAIDIMQTLKYFYYLDTTKEKL